MKDNMKYDMTVACIGAGYVGGPTSAVIAYKCKNIKVLVLDIDEKRIDAWNSNTLPVYEPGLEGIIDTVRDKNLFFSTNIEEGIKESDIIFIAVNTPTKKFGVGSGQGSDLKNFELAARSIGKYSTSNKIIVEKSTLPVQTAKYVKIILNAASKKEHPKKDIKFEILSNPEFLAEGTAISDLLNPDRVLIGNDDTKEGEKASEKLSWLYQHWVPKKNIVTTNLYSAELSKLVANAFLAQRVSSINSISALCEKVGADCGQIAAVIGKDKRIGSKFLQASVGFGGSCFLKDIKNLVYLSRTFNLHEVADYWNQVIIMNEYQKKRFVLKIVDSMFSTITGKKISIFGFAFKRQTGDTRESAAIYVSKYLLQERAKLSIYDPKVTETQIRSDFKEYKVLDEGLEFDKYTKVESDPYKSVKDSHAIAVLTEWKIFKTYDYKKMYDSMEKPAFIFDGRNVLDHKKLRDIGFIVYNIGSKQPETFK